MDKATTTADALELLYLNQITICAALGYGLVSEAPQRFITT